MASRPQSSTTLKQKCESSLSLTTSISVQTFEFDFRNDDGNVNDDGNDDKDSTRWNVIYATLKIREKEHFCDKETKILDLRMKKVSIENDKKKIRMT